MAGSLYTYFVSGMGMPTSWPRRGAGFDFSRPSCSALCGLRVVTATLTALLMAKLKYPSVKKTSLKRIYAKY